MIIQNSHQAELNSNFNFVTQTSTYNVSKQFTTINIITTPKSISLHKEITMSILHADRHIGTLVGLG